MAKKSKMKKNRFRTEEEEFLEVDDIDLYVHQKVYFKSRKGKKALQKARKAYDKRNIEKRRKQKRDYMRRKREKDPDIWRN
jgi:tmRNA-binding protein